MEINENKPNIKRLRRVIYFSKCYQKKYKTHSYPYEIIFHTNDRLYVLSNGDVGIGLSAPAYKLNVNGNIYPDPRCRDSGRQDSSKQGSNSRRNG